VENCLFVDNASNCEMDKRSSSLGTWLPKVGHGAVTIFSACKGEFRNCTFVGNRNGVDDWSPTSTYDKCIFWSNTADGGWPTDSKYETDITNASGVNQCFIGGGISDRRSRLDPKRNVLDAPDPQFDGSYVPRNVIYEDIGYRPTQVGREKPSRADASLPATTEAPLFVRARGSNFNWYFSYAGDDGILNTDDDIRTRRHLFLPTGRPVRIQLESDDYLYSLKLPAQGANEIAVPGLVHYCTVRETKAGSYPLNGDQFCGYAHPDLVGRVIVQPLPLFAKSLAANNIQ
jgi:hypothetical protein